MWALIPPEPNDMNEWISPFFGDNSQSVVIAPKWKMAKKAIENFTIHVAKNVRKVTYGN